MRPLVLLAVTVGVAGSVALCVGGTAGYFAGLQSAETDAIEGPFAGDEPLDAAPDSDVSLGWSSPDVFRDVRFHLPADAVAVRLRATSRTPVLLRATTGEADTGQWDAEALEGANDQHLDLAGHVHVHLRGATLTVRVEAFDFVRKDDSFHAVLRADVIRASETATLEKGGSWTGACEPSSGFRRAFRVHVPPGVGALRFDLADATADLDLTASSEPPGKEPEPDPRSPAVDEWLVLDAETDPPLVAGSDVWVTVTDPATCPYPVPFRIVVTEGREPPAELSKLPDLALPRDPRERAILSTVELVLTGGGGSGTLVSADGRILTAYHVVESAVPSAPDEPGNRIVVALTLDPRSLAKDLFEAEFVEGDRALDLALLRITGTARGLPLPPGTQFPFVERRRRTAPFPGDLVWTVGYPQIGGSGTRVPLTVSRGVVAGWDRAEACVQIKTDAVVAPGSSGGAAFDDRWELLGVPVASSGEGGRSLGSLVPVESVPASWWGR